MAAPRPHIMCSNRPIYVGDVAVSGVKAKLIVYVKTGSRRHRMNFFHYCRSVGIAYERLEHHEPSKDNPDGWGHQTAFQIIGTPDAIVECNEREFVTESHFALSVRIPVQAMGACEERRIPMAYQLHPDYRRNDVRS